MNVRCLFRSFFAQILNGWNDSYAWIKNIVYYFYYSASPWCGKILRFFCYSFFEPHNCHWLETFEFTLSAQLYVLGKMVIIMMRANFYNCRPSKWNDRNITSSNSKKKRSLRSMKRGNSRNTIQKTALWVCKKKTSIFHTQIDRREKKLPNT